MKIRQDQIDELRKRAVADFEKRALLHIREHFPAESASESDMQVVERVRLCRERASQYGLTTQKEIMCFVDTTYMLGWDFDDGKKGPEFRKLLNAKELSSTEKAGVLAGWAHSLWKLERAGGGAR